MTRKQFLILVLALIVLGGASLALFWQDIASYQASGAKIGGRVLPEFKVADVTEVRLQDAKGSATLQRKESGWVVAERNGYPANAQAIGDFIIKLADLKITQADAVGESLWPRVNLAAPDAKEGGGLLVEFKNASGKVLAAAVLGKTVLKKDPLNPLPGAQDGVPAGRYVRTLGERPAVIVVNDPLNAANAAPGKWLSKTFIKIDRVKTLAVGPADAAPAWKIARDEEWGQWKFAAGGGDLYAGAAVSATNALGRLSFSDIALKPQDGGGKATQIVAETFDNLTYKLTLTPTGDKYLLKFAITGEPPKARVAEKGEKPEDKARRDKEFEAARKQLEDRIALERILSNWAYVLEKSEVQALLRDRSDLVVPKR
jgi:hypothetical protein